MIMSGSGVREGNPGGRGSTVDVGRPQPGGGHDGGPPGLAWPWPPLVAAVDAGTTGARAMAYDLDGGYCRRGALHRTRPPRPGPAGPSRTPGDWAEGAVAALRGLARPDAPCGEIRAIGLTGQCPTMVVADSRGRPLRAGMMYRDNRAVAEARQMRDRVGDRAMHERTGHLPEAFHVGPKLLWIRQNEPEVSPGPGWCSSRGTWSCTGCPAWPPPTRPTRTPRCCSTCASGRVGSGAAGGLRRRSGAVPRRLCRRGPRRAELPERVAGELGLLAGVPLVIGAADSQCAAFGAGVIAPGPVSEMAGRSSCLNSVVLSPLADLRVTHYSHVVPDCFSTELGVNTTGAAISQAVRALGYPGFGELAADAEQVPACGSAAAQRAQRARAMQAVEAAPLFLPHLGDGGGTTRPPGRVHRPVRPA